MPSIWHASRLAEIMHPQVAWVSIQSGNIIFCAEGIEPAEMQARIKQGIAQQFGHDIEILVHHSKYIKQVLTQLPFADIDLASQGTQVMISFMSEAPDEQIHQNLMQWVKSPDVLVINEDVVYLHCPNGYGKSKLSNVFVEKKLQVFATTRNLKTLHKLCEFAS